MNSKKNRQKAKKTDGKNTHPLTHTQKKNANFTRQVDIKTERKLKARRRPAQAMWFGLGMMGVIGWSVVIPTLLGVALGLWLDSHYAEDQRSWTLALLIAGLTLGCFNAWYWVDKEQQAMHKDQEHKDE